MFDDLDDGAFDRELARPVKQAAELFPCGKCNGTGIYTFGYRNPQSGKCHACKGKGGFATSQTHRTKARQQRQARKVNDAEQNWINFTAAHPTAAQWLMANNGNFATSLRDGVKKWGSLTEKQLAAVMRIIETPAPAKATLDLTAVFDKFTTAQEAGLKKPKLRLDGLCFMLAGGANAGMIYVKAGPAYEDTYLGKVAPSGEFSKSRDCTPEHLDQLTSLTGDLLAAAVAYGRKTGQCSCCGRELTDPNSIEAGIGPICADKWGM